MIDRALLLAAACTLALLPRCDAKRWSPQELQNPRQTTSSHCNSRYGSLSAVCDPSGLVSREQRYSIDRAISALESHHATGTCRSYKIAATVVRYMQNDRYSSTSQLASRMAQTLFQEWNMGDCGVLLFASTGDRRVYIAVGVDARKVLTSRRMQGVIKHMTQYFAREDPGRALLIGVQDIARYVAPGGFASSPARSTKHVGDEDLGLFGWELTLTVVVAGIALAIACCNGVGGPERARFNALMRKERCALCLKKFNAPLVSSPVPPADSQAPEQDEPRLPADEITLPCGHVFHRTAECWEGWSATSQDCPLCQVSEGAATIVESENASTKFRLQRVAALHPELSDYVAAESKRLENRTIRRVEHVRTGVTDERHHGSGPGLGWMLGAGAAGAALGSMFSGGHSNDQHNPGGSFWNSGQQVSGDGGGWGAPSFSVGGGDGGGWMSHFGGGDGGGWGGGGGDWAGGGGGGDGGGW